MERSYLTEFLLETQAGNLAPHLQARAAEEIAALRSDNARLREALVDLEVQADVLLKRSDDAHQFSGIVAAAERARAALAQKGAQ